MLNDCFRLIGSLFDRCFSLLEIAETELNFIEVLISLVALGGVVTFLIAPFVGKLKGGKK